MRDIIIKKLINGGKGLAKDEDGVTLLVDGGLPGETVRLKNIEKKKGYKTAAVKNVIKANRARTEPACPWYKQCGGCDLMHCSYAYQLDIKKEIIEDLYTRQFGQGEAEKCPVNTVLPSPSEFHYRQRIRLVVSDGQELGYRQAQSHLVTAIDSCLIAKQQINQALNSINTSHTARHFTSLSREVELQWNPASDLITVIFHLARKPRPADKTKADELLEELSIVEHIILCGEGFQPVNMSRLQQSCRPTLSFQMSLGENDRLIDFQWEAGAFCQVNIAQNINMIRTVLDFAQAQSDETILDLYCGMGNFSLPLSLYAKSVEAMEGQGASIRCAKSNSTRNEMNNIAFTKTDIHQGCSKLLEEKRWFDCVIVDPPRAGIPDLYDQLDKLTRKRLVYISCDPATLFRDLHQLTDRGFSIKQIQPVDMFPQTHHIETVVLLEKN